eukprot:6180712-Pleurochrysis_carterae.AAC.2
MLLLMRLRLSLLRFGGCQDWGYAASWDSSKVRAAERACSLSARRVPVEGDARRIAAANLLECSLRHDEGSERAVCAEEGDRAILK